ncbi:MAG: hypothetical protein WC389_05155 [Lutibacter sp.]|jgi:hypothetical protein
MKVAIIDKKEYKLPSSLTKFQKELYVHLINYKWEKLKIKDVGLYKYKGELIEYDAILPKAVHNKFPLIYPTILNDLKQHKKEFNFKLHNHFNHMASSQAANVNLFLPILVSKRANEIFRMLKPDFKELAVSELYKGFRIEYWDGNSNKERGLLKDHSSLSGTDSDIAIAYYNHSDELCLWLIEHKLTEKEFTVCGGFKSKDRDKEKHLCSKSFSEIVLNKDYCFHHIFKERKYWNITDENQSFFANASNVESCPFKGGMNQLWRNQLLGFALEKESKFKKVCFSVVHHPENHSLVKSINEYKNLIANNSKFSTFTSKDVIEKAQAINDIEIEDWVLWYKELYKV